MLKHILLLLAGMIVISSTGQDTTFFDSDWDEVETRDGARYFRLDNQTGNIINREDYYIGGQVQMTGKYRIEVNDGKEEELKIGEFIWYYPDGQKSFIRRFENGEKVSEESWFKNGQKRGEIDFVKESDDSDSREAHYIIWYDSLGNKTMENGKGSIEEYYMFGGISSRFNLKKGELHGKKVNYSSEGDITTVLEYKRGKFKSGVNHTGDEVVEFDEIMVMPEFDGGTNGLMKYLKQNIKYPEEDRLKNIQGSVHVQFVVMSDGSIKHAEVIKSVSPKLNAEALRVVKEMPKWEPGVYYGLPVNVKFVLPIVFRLQ